MPALVDANILVRLRDQASPDHVSSLALYRAAAAKPADFSICAQTLIEFWVVATRPRSVNGLGLSPQEAGVDVRDFLTIFPLLPEPPTIARVWHELVARYPTVIPLTPGQFLARQPGPP